ncbi:oxalurate catabolism protein HpxZ [Elioraea thermophila]|uniref:oxalurate catabolism protein HpxZ n=1 Tax=Elioraea thermophila TaxID=2185104 RepID=UPI000DF18B3C|nr:oxalurate catabolism protein HpxZ [Elioraea thermophila]
MDVDHADTLAEARAVLDRYEAALMANDVAVLDELFWDDPRTVRFGVGEILLGADAIRRFRRSRAGSGYPRRERLETLITTFGRDIAVTNIVFRRLGDGTIGRETKILARLPGIGWRIVSAHVSLAPPGTAIER